MAMNRYPSNRRGSFPTTFGDWSGMFPGFTGPTFFSRSISTGAVAPVDVCERENEFIIRLACAGCRPEDIDVTVEDDVVRIRGRFPEHEAMGMGQEQSRSTSGSSPQGQTQVHPGQGQSQGQASQAQAASSSPAHGSPMQSSQTTGGAQSTGRASGGQMTSQSSQTPSEQCLIRELPTGRFERDITLPMAVNSQQAQARFDNGLLCLTLPKARAPQGHRIQIGHGQTSAAQSGTEAGTGSR